MQSFTYAVFSIVDIVALLMLSVSFLMFIFFTVRAKRGGRFTLRPIRAYERIRQLVSHATESGRAIHLGMGSGRLGSEATPEALMGITVLDYLARGTAQYDYPLVGTTGSPTILASAQGVRQRANRGAGVSGLGGSKDVRFYGPDPFAYAAGTWDTLREKEHLANIAIGQFDAEGLWICESTRTGDIMQLGGTSDPAAAMLMQISLDDAVIGEEVFAAGAYLHRPSHLGSLATQDFMRIVIILSIIAGVVMTSLGYWS